MAIIRMYREKLRHNFSHLEKLFTRNNIEWGVVAKLLCGNPLFLRELLDLGITEVHDSRVSNLKAIKKLNPAIQTCYIKPPAKRAVKSIVQYADISFNTQIETMRLLSAEAKKQGKVHKVIIMVEMGDLREGVMGDDLIDFYEQVFEMPNLEVIGLGTNLNCLHGVMPSKDKLIQLCLYEQLIEAKFNKHIRWISGGTSVVIPLLLRKQLPKGVNHFRVGEALYFGNNLFTGKPFTGMKTDVFKLFAEIIELEEKPKVPHGELAENPSGETFEMEEKDFGKTHYRGLLDVGLLDIHPDFLIPDDPKVKLEAASSDMLVIDLGDDPGWYKVGDFISFNLKYMGALRLLNSDYISKEIV